MAVTTLDTIEGMVGEGIHFHYDIGGDVLYLRTVSTRGTDSYSEETDDGFILVRDMVTDKPVGLTIVSYWKRFGGQRRLTDMSLSDLDTLFAKSARRAADILRAA